MKYSVTWLSGIEEGKGEGRLLSNPLLIILPKLKNTYLNNSYIQLSTLGS